MNVVLDSCFKQEFKKLGVKVMSFEGDFTDIHCHILPALDDGAADFTETEKMLQTASEEGIRRIIATPHNYATRKSASVESIKECVNWLNIYAEECGIPISLYNGNEIYYRSGIVDLLEKGEILTLANSRYVLVEFDPGVDYSYLRDGLGELLRFGYYPILAHAERYDCLFQKKDRLKELKNSGIYIQVNASSFLQGFMSEIKKRIKILLKDDWIDFVGTDAHSNRSRAPKMKQCTEYMNKKLGKEKTGRILYDNPQAIIEGRRI